MLLLCFLQVWDMMLLLCLGLGYNVIVVFRSGIMLLCVSYRSGIMLLLCLCLG